YGLVFDAGSMHTALYIYWWPVDKENGTGIVSQVEACTAAGPGISSYADDPTGAGASLKPCLDKAMEIIPAEQQRETPTYLGATAGMRLLRYSTAQSQHLHPSHHVLLHWSLGRGWSQWVTPGAGQCSLTGSWTHLPAEDVVGALDLWGFNPGGASTQITFLPGTTIEDSSTGALLRLYGTNYSIYTHSYLCYGQKQALKMLMASLHQASPSTAQISHPCYPRGYEENITTAELYDSPCVRAPSTPSAAQLLRVMGTGEPAACSTAVQHSVNATIGRFCTSTWEKVLQEFPTMSRTQVRDACAASTYTLALLLQGFRFNHTTWLNIHFARQVSDVDVGWTLGYVLNLTNMIPSEIPQRVVGLQRSNWIAATVLLATMLILTFCLLTLMCCQKSSSGYVSL
ncbi:PREDICTED: LOW QUALITY PROTEIN: ectonucleoside triphosphate diphosphohydrolase 8-like, partial [Nestor notabilis]|uniref:LOW QUALITY PROTEIN: ectonucleoside triphosphate diphosphohydrolase 8-like n=1 Tax=Nestor notabilis TaxID=176057 RepID=UPI0005239DAD